MPKVLRDIELSKKVVRCKNCKELKMIRYLDDILCDKCEKAYRNTLAKIMEH
jgi:Zn finger protein HypA/HybF involved in hydrogenase expression